MMNLRPLFSICFSALLAFSFTLIPNSSKACNLSSYKLDSITNPNLGVYNIYSTLCVGGGVLGVNQGANNSTNTFAFAFYALGSGPFAINSFSPASVLGDSTSCSMPGAVFGPVATFGSQQTIAYNDPGCPNDFICVSSTANCGRPHTQVISLVFTTDFLPDSIRVLGIEGAGNPFAGCYNIPQMVIYPSFPIGCNNDTIPPTITCPQNATIPVNANCQGILPNFTSSATVSDNCDPNPSVTQSPNQGTTVGGVGSSINVTLFASDNGQNSSSTIYTSSCQFTVTATDQTGPTLSCPPNQTLAANANCMATLSNYIPNGTISDNCDPNPSITTQTPSAGSMVSGTTTISLFGIDNASNGGSCTFLVTVQDQTPPTITCPPAQNVYLGTNCQALVPAVTGLAQASDNCVTNVSIAQSPAAGNPMPGTSQATITLTADDGANNTTTCTVLVTALDTMTPQITCPANVTFTPTTLDCNPSINWTAPTGTDNCQAMQSSTHNPGDNFPVGTTTVIYTVMDSSSNSANCNFTVTVNPPAIGQVITPSSTNPCVGDTVSLVANTGFSSYLWSTTETTSNIEVTTSGMYYVDVFNGANCTVRDSILINFQPLPLPVITQSGNTICTSTFNTYQWFSAGTAISGATSACYTPTTNTNYTVVVTDSNGCENTSLPLMYVGLEPGNVGPGFALYPNPAHRTVQLQLQQDLLSHGQILIFDLAGKVVFRKGFESLSGTTALDLSGLAEGSYLVEISAGELRGRRHLIHLK